VTVAFLRRVQIFLLTYLLTFNLTLVEVLLEYGTQAAYCPTAAASMSQYSFFEIRQPDINSTSARDLVEVTTYSRLCLPIVRF